MRMRCRMLHDDEPIYGLIICVSFYCSCLFIHLSPLLMNVVLISVSDHYLRAEVEFLHLTKLLCCHCKLQGVTMAPYKATKLGIMFIIIVALILSSNNHVDATAVAMQWFSGTLRSLSPSFRSLDSI
jgi:uncharacterized membrane protein